MDIRHITPHSSMHVYCLYPLGCQPVSAGRLYKQRPERPAMPSDCGTSWMKRLSWTFTKKSFILAASKRYVEASNVLKYSGYLSHLWYQSNIYSKQFYSGSRTIVDPKRNCSVLPVTTYRHRLLLVLFSTYSPY